MYKKMISLTAIMAMIVILVMPARAYADETQAESQPVLKYSVLMSGASEWQEADNGEYVGEPENKDAEIKIRCFGFCNRGKFEWNHIFGSRSRGKLE